LAAALLAGGCHQAADPCAPPETAADRAAPPARHTPRWAFEPWISKDISDTDDTYAFVDGFAQRDIPVGVVVLDSPWETHYNTFVPNPTRYHDFDQLVADLHGRDMRIVLWITQMVNNYGMDFEVGGDTFAVRTFAVRDGRLTSIAQGNGHWNEGRCLAICTVNPDDPDRMVDPRATARPIRGSRQARHRRHTHGGRMHRGRQGRQVQCRRNRGVVGR